MKIRIKAAAIKHDGKIYSLPQPNRHADVAELIYKEVKPCNIKDIVEGYLTSEDQFVDRVEAKRVAVKAGQQTNLRGHNFDYRELYSVDIW
tara:strand:+ start:72604 stop:72876 length:273 start_codon:yes stop_codon:yes gene_type:complete